MSQLENSITPACVFNLYSTRDNIQQLSKQYLFLVNGKNFKRIKVQ